MNHRHPNFPLVASAVVCLFSVVVFATSLSWHQGETHRIGIIERIIKTSQGKDGLRGPKGEQGPQGARGAVGARGPQGLTGQKGAAGTNGKQGAQGPAGKDGAQGVAGKDGISIPGPVGPTGPRGPQGEQGEAPTLQQIVNAVCARLIVVCR